MQVRRGCNRQCGSTPVLRVAVRANAVLCIVNYTRTCSVRWRGVGPDLNGHATTQAVAAQAWYDAAVDELAA
jgi:hypothetical protein